MLLALGRGAELVGELEALVAREPLRERLRAQLMLARYRSGRQGDALDVYRDAVRTASPEA
jgi:DNA-binding SARP family transcriptional activator